MTSSVKMKRDLRFGLIKRKVCNVCGKVDDYPAFGFDICKAEMGYGTTYDGSALDLHICAGCMQKLIDDCKVNPCTRRG